ncbi:MAG: hypothetical protein PHP52_03840 [Bacteroidales bacterium]|nr:hypothetical protein [Bacteroidales bacterium]MDD4216575.1 hypothetical protein [Bacteroidales bacterium]MDY0141348.1 hypothetical protein [Bacteroidales bacterium]
MVINKKELSARIKLGIMLISLVLVALVVVSLIFSWSKNHLFEYILVGVYVLFMAFVFVKNYNYVYYNSDGPKIIFRYIPLSPLTAGNYSIEIPRRDFVNAELKTSFFGLRKYLILYVKSAQGVAKFKPVSLSIMSKSEINDIISELSNINK